MLAKALMVMPDRLGYGGDDDDDCITLIRCNGR